MTAHSASSSNTPSAVSWLALVAPVVAWAAQELASFYVSASRCAQGQAMLPRAALIDISLLALTVTVAASVVAGRNFLRIRANSVLTRGESREPGELFALVSLVLGIVLVLAVIWGTLPSLLVSRVCEAGA